ncbi:MAG: branched-chain amino acid ABC transporter permease [Alphaproteobacteria bacterium]|nr:branched-chain amino acid ABC transporter permease [Alphaproteobacteria bacterium]
MIANLLSTENIVFTGVNILLAWSVYLTLMTGTLSFAMAAFMGIGAYVSGILTAKFGWPLVPAALVGTLACLAGGILVGFPALRVRGLYLMLVTTGVTLVVKVAIENIEYVGGVGGMGGLRGTTPELVLASVVVIGGALWLLSRTPLQRIMDAAREDENVAASLGINIVFIRVAGFAAGAALAGYAGALYGHYIIFIAPEQFDILYSVFIALYVVLGGVNNLWGPVLGAVVITMLPEVVREFGVMSSGFRSARQLIFAGALVLLLLVRPAGILAFRRLSIRAGRGRVPVGST